MPLDDKKPTLVLVATGGTISMVWDAKQGTSVPALKAADLLARSSYTPNITVRAIDLDYNTGKIEHLLSLARCLRETGDSQVDGIVVTHGTDALEEVAYGIDEVLAAPVPIVFTGAMRPNWASDFDGISNLNNAISLATTTSSAYGVLVTMNNDIFEAWSVYKSDTTALDAFAARRGAPYGGILGDRVSCPWKPTLRKRFARIPESLPASVPILMMGIADDGSLLNKLSETSLHGLVVAGMATGTIPPTARKRVLQLAARGVPVVLCSSAVSGTTADERYYPHAYDDLHNAGVVIENWLSPRKARIRLMLSLALHEPYVPFGEGLSIA
ncbi:MAG: hypothetical protein FJ147_05815 [Deltaproteobacteria bacterium]|nr:hypothetical protein [Deltaproteobacteria bacterium]